MNHFCLLFWLFIFHLGSPELMTPQRSVSAMTNCCCPHRCSMPIFLGSQDPMFCLVVFPCWHWRRWQWFFSWLCQYRGMNCSCYPQAILNHKRMTCLGQWGSRCAACLTVLTMTYYQTAKAAKALKFHLQNASHNQTARRRSPHPKVGLRLLIHQQRYYMIFLDPFFCHRSNTS